MMHSKIVRWSVVAAFALSMTAFGAAILISQRSAAEMEEILAQISENASPSVDHLAAASALLGRLHVRLLKVRTALAEGQVAELEPTLALADFDREVALADATPDFPGERALREGLQPSLARAREVTVRVQAAVQAHDARLASRLIDQDVPAAYSAATSGVRKLMGLNLEFGRLAARDAQRVRLESQQLAYSLGATASVVTVGLVVWLLLSMRRLAKADEAWGRRTEERSREMELFASRVAHDIRSPLGAALLTCEHAVRIEGTPPKLIPMLRRIASGLRHTSTLVDGLYEFARAGSATSRSQATPLQECVDRVIDDVAPMAREAEVSLRCAPLPVCRVAAAPGVVSSILLNLVSNAVRYGGSGGAVTVRARAADRVEVEVEDTGPGVPPGAEARIFQPFTREDGGRGEGLGLGLATVKRLVEGHGGACGVRSGAGQGSIFWFVLPRATSGASAEVRPLRPIKNA